LACGYTKSYKARRSTGFIRIVAVDYLGYYLRAYFGGDRLDNFLYPWQFKEWWSWLRILVGRIKVI